MLRTSRHSAVDLVASSDATSALTFGCTPEYSDRRYAGWFLPGRRHLCPAAVVGEPTRKSEQRRIETVCILSRGSAPLRRLCQSSPVNPGLPHPAPSVPDLSQVFDGFLLALTCPLCFTQAPPMGFKEPRSHRLSLARVPTGCPWSRALARSPAEAGDLDSWQCCYVTKQYRSSCPQAIHRCDPWIAAGRGLANEDTALSRKTGHTLCTTV